MCRFLCEYTCISNYSGNNLSPAQSVGESGVGANLIFGNHPLTRDKWMIWEMVLWGEFVVIIFLLLPDHSLLLLSLSDCHCVCVCLREWILEKKKRCRKAKGHENDFVVYSNLLSTTI